MSNVYVLEPPTSGKVVFTSSVGDIEIELWSKQSPKACRNFIQLCMEGYYDNTIFHRVVKDFIVQGGDPSGTGTGGESIYGKPFKDEFHSRLRFNRRGLVAMASTGPHSNTSQFFITLDRCDSLNNQHTIFGKVAGDTIFNVIKMNDFQVDEDDRPTYPPTILSAEVISNPFDDIIPRELKPRVVEETEEERRQKLIKKKMHRKNKGVLSFAGDEEEERVDDTVAPKMKSSHHFSSTSQASIDEVQRLKKEYNATDPNDKRKRDRKALLDRAEKRKRIREEQSHQSESDPVKQKDSALDDPTSINDVVDALRTERSIKSKEVEDKKRQDMKKKKRELKKSILKFKKNPESSLPKKDENEAFMSPLEAQRMKYKRNATKRNAGKQKTMDRLSAWKGSLHASDAPEWKKHKFEFTPLPGTIKEDEEEDNYSVFDPLKGKRDKSSRKRRSRNSNLW